MELLACTTHCCQLFLYYLSLHNSYNPVNRHCDYVSQFTVEKWEIQIIMTGCNQPMSSPMSRYVGFNPWHLDWPFYLAASEGHKERKRIERLPTYLPVQLTFWKWPRHSGTLFSSLEFNSGWKGNRTHCREFRNNRKHKWKESQVWTHLRRYPQ